LNSFRRNRKKCKIDLTLLPSAKSSHVCTFDIFVSILIYNISDKQKV